MASQDSDNDKPKRELRIVYPPMFCANANNSRFEHWFSPETIRYCAAESPQLLKGDVMMLGDGGVGKTSLMERACTGDFSESYIATIGMDYRTVIYRVIDSVDLRMLVWDTAGQERFGGRMSRRYYNRANAFAVCFDASKVESLINVTEWICEARNLSGSGVKLFLVGNKSDILDDNAYKNIVKLAIEVAEKLRAELWMVSAKTGDKVNELFNRIASTLVDPLVRRSFQRSNLSSNKIVFLHDTNSSQHSKSCCGHK